MGSFALQFGETHTNMPTGWFYSSVCFSGLLVGFLFVLFLKICFYYEKRFLIGIAGSLLLVRVSLDPLISLNKLSLKTLQMTQLKHSDLHLVDFLMCPLRKDIPRQNPMAMEYVSN